MIFINKLLLFLYCVSCALVYFFVSINFTVLFAILLLAYCYVLSLIKNLAIKVIGEQYSKFVNFVYYFTLFCSLITYVFISMMDFQTFGEAFGQADAVEKYFDEIKLLTIACAPILISFIFLIYIFLISLLKRLMTKLKLERKWIEIMLLTMLILSIVRYNIISSVLISYVTWHIWHDNYDKSIKIQWIALMIYDYFLKIFLPINMVFSVIYIIYSIYLMIRLRNVKYIYWFIMMYYCLPFFIGFFGGFYKALYKAL